MGYPEAKIRHPGDGRLSHTPYEPSSQIAGTIAWYYEREGMTPMLIGHSQGGIQAVKVLYELAGAFGDRVRVWNPLTDAAEDRTTIVDPLTGRERPVVGLRVGYVSVVGAGGAALLLPNQWTMAGRLRTIPDTVEEFTGYTIGVDMFAWDFSGAASDFRSNGTRDGAQRPPARRLLPRHRRGDLASRPRQGDARLAQRLPAGRGERRAGGVRSDRQRALGRRRLVQHQEALGDRGPAADPRQARTCAAGLATRGNDVRTSRRKDRARHRRRARHRPRDRAEARRRRLRRGGELLQQPRRGRGPVRRDPRARAGARSRSRRASAMPDSVDELFVELQQALRPSRHRREQRRERRAAGRRSR